MKCDLCKRDETNGNLLCATCGDMIGRLITIQRRMNSRDVCEAERLAQTANAPRANWMRIGKDASL